MGVLVREIPKGSGNWVVKIHLNGTRTQQSVGSKTAGIALKKKLDIKITEGKFGISEKPTLTFYEVATDWLNFVRQSRSVGTYTRYSGIVKMHVGSLLNMPIDKINRGDIRNLLLGLKKRGSSKSSIGLTHTVISGIFCHALEDELVDKNPAVLMMRRLDIKKDSKEVKPFSEEEFNIVLDNIEPQYSDFFEVAYHTGARVGELCALTWGDIDWLKRKVRVSKTAKDQVVKESTKTYTDRNVDMSERLFVVLTKIKKSDRVLCLKLGIPQKHIFHDNGKLLSQNTLRRKLNTACKKVGIPRRTIHDIRHTFASILLSRGVPLNYVSKMLGHAGPAITLKCYSHYMPSESEGLIDVLTSGGAEKKISAQ